MRRTDMVRSVFALQMASKARHRALLATYWPEKASESRGEAIESFYDWLREAQVLRGET